MGDDTVGKRVRQSIIQQVRQIRQSGGMTIQGGQNERV